MTEKTPSPTGDRSATRRDALSAVGATGALVLAGCVGGGGDDSGGNGNGENETDSGTTDTNDGDTVRIGISIPQSGVRDNEGEQMLAGYQLAAKHINNGTGGVTVEPFTDIGGDGGLLGREVELVVGDTESTESGAQSSAETLIDDEGVQMFTGGASADEGLSHQEVAADRGVIYMGGFTPGNDIGGEACTRFAFNEMYNIKMAADSLAPIVGREVGLDSDVTFAQLYPETEFGNEFFTEIGERFSSLSSGWVQQGGVETREGERSYTSSLEQVLGDNLDLLFLNYYGLNAANALRDLNEFDTGDLTVVVPIFNREFARTAGDALQNVFGTVHWPPEPPSGEGWASGRATHPFRQTFVDTWEPGDVGVEVPSPVSHLAYVQLCQYAAAVSRAGTFDVDPVISELEGYSYDYGRGEQTMRACDHQAVRTVPVVRGLPPEQRQLGNFYALSELQSATTVGVSAAYDCDETPASNCSME
jgi:ABC-type branched-subunit amino acid transport system substrate-binding protein